MVRDVFDIVLKDYPSMKTHLSVPEKCVKSPVFENGLVKILRSKCNTMTEGEQVATKHLRKDNNLSDSEEEISEESVG